MTPSARTLQLARERLGEGRGRRFWRALEELADDPAFRRELTTAMPQLASLAPMDRRGFLRLLGASLALAGLAGCSGPPQEKIVPWVRKPDSAGTRFYATTLDCGGDVTGVLVETHDGRPTKIEGNPQHPASLGATGRLPQAGVLELWDPDRSTEPMRSGQPTSWNVFAAELAQWRQAAGRGERVRVLSGALRSPTLRAQRRALLHRFPALRWHEHEPAGSGQSEAGARLAFGRAVVPRYHLAEADVLVTLDADLLDGMPGHLAYARAFAARRHPDRPGATMNRLYAIEPTPSVTGSIADHRWPLAASRIGASLRQLAAALGLGDMSPGADIPLPAPWLQALADDLDRHRGRSLLVVGESQPAAVHALAHRLNAALGNVGQTVDYIDPFDDAQEDPLPDLASLEAAMREGKVDLLVMLDTNPVQSAPADIDFAESLAKVAHSVHLGLFRDETARHCDWHLPMAHALEAWSDRRAFDGAASIVQPVISPLYDGRSAHELVAMIGGDLQQRGMDIVRNYWAGTDGKGVLADDDAWERALRNGVIDGANAPPAVVTAASPSPGWWRAARPEGKNPLELLFRPDPTVWDGRYANNGWLQELPKPVTQLTWSNAALVSPRLAEREGLANGDLVALACHGRRVEAPVWITPGQAEHSITVHLGYGRRHSGRVGDGLGFDAYALRTVAEPWTATGVTVTATGRRVELAGTQQHFAMEGRELVRSTDLATFRDHPRFAQDPKGTPPSFYPPQAGDDYAWGMTIDLNSCIGCKGCTIACQAENNIPVVGADEVRRGREMHWIRVDRYYQGSPDAPSTLHQPVPCMHCEHAPCELVCPVGATVHDAEGLNVQIYNRCVGTRFCSNNCPYKVRRFNFLQYSELDSATLAAQRNPDVTVRNRGVMEKCTYCIQRIETAHIAADRQGRAIADGEVVTACQAACPTQAIQFGNLRDPASAVSQSKASPLNYVLLEELNTRPRTSYLAQVRNPHPDLGDDA